MTDSEEGSASVVMLAVCVLVLIAAMVVTSAVTAVEASHRARTGADLAALAGAEHASSGTEMACAWARATATANDTTLIGCHIDGDEVFVTATAEPAMPIPGIGSTAEARAGPVA